eukprot:446194-Rhodomonas_salina.1
MKDWQRKSWKCTLRPSHCTAKGEMECFVSERREIDGNYVRLTMVPHKLSEKFALLQLLMVELCRDLLDLKFSSESFMQAAVSKGYINSGNEGILAFNEASDLHRTPRELLAFLTSLMLDGESFLAILHDDNQEPRAHNILALTLNQDHFMTPTNRYSWMIDFLHDKLEQREHNALQEEVAKWNVYEQEAKHDVKLEKVRRIPKQSDLYDLIKAQLLSSDAQCFGISAAVPLALASSFLLSYGCIWFILGGG